MEADDISNDTSSMLENDEFDAPSSDLQYESEIHHSNNDRVSLLQDASLDTDNPIENHFEIHETHTNKNERYSKRHHHNLRARRRFTFIPESIWKQLSYFPYLLTLLLLTMIFLTTLIVSLFHSFNTGSQWNAACKPLSMYYYIYEEDLFWTKLISDPYTNLLNKANINKINKKIKTKNENKQGGGLKSKFESISSIGYLMANEHDYSFLEENQENASSTLNTYLSIEEYEIRFIIEPTIQKIYLNQFNSIEFNRGQEFLFDTFLKDNLQYQDYNSVTIEDSISHTLTYDTIITFNIKDSFTTECIRLHAENIDLNGAEAYWREYPSEVSKISPTFTFKPKIDSNAEKKFKENFRKAQISYTNDVNSPYEDLSNYRNFEVNNSSSLVNKRGIVLHFNKKLEKGKYQVYIKVTKPPLESWAQIDVFGNESEGNYSQISYLYPTFSSNFIPSLDEPVFRSIFRIQFWFLESKQNPMNLQYISNMHIESTEINEINNNTQFRVIKFMPTPEISTYMSGCFLGEFEYIENVYSIELPSSIDNKVYESSSQSQNHTQEIIFRIYTPRNYTHLGETSLEIARNATKIVSTLLQIPFPHNKLDIFPLTDIETIINGIYGIVPVRNSLLLIDKNIVSKDTKFLSVIAIFDGIVNQWTSNLISMKKLSQISILRGMTHLISHIAIQEMNPDYISFNKIIMFLGKNYMDLDSLQNTRSLFIDSDEPDIYMTNHVLSLKSALIFNSMRNMMGSSKFIQWLSKLISNYSFKSISTLDLVSSFPTELRRNYLDWFINPGYPLIEIQELSENNQKLKYFQQSPYSFNNTRNESWWIPLNILYSNGIVEEIDFFTENMTIHSVITDWYLLRSDLPCRINYPMENWKKLIQMIRGGHPWISDLDQLKLIQDAFSFAKFKDLPFSIVIDLAKAISNHRSESLVSWNALISEIVQLSRIVHRLSGYPFLHRFCKKLIYNVSKYMDWGSILSQEWDELQMIIFEAGSYFGVENIIQHGIEAFNKLSSNSTFNIDPQALNLILKNAIRHGNDENFFWILDRTLSHKSIVSRIEASALSQAREPSLVKTTIDIIMSRKIPKTSRIIMFRELIKNPYAINIVWDYFQEYQNDIISRFGLSEASTLLHIFAENFSSSLHLKEIDQFNDLLPPLHISTSKEIIIHNQMFIQNKYDEMLQVLKNELNY